MSNQRKRELDEKELQILKKMAANPSATRVAARQRFKCSARVLERWLDDHNIEWVSAPPGAHPTKDELEKIREWAKDPAMGYKCIGIELTRSAETIQKWVREYNIEWVAFSKSLQAKKREAQRRKEKQEQCSHEQILNTYNKLRRAEATATCLGVSVNKVYSVLREHGVKYGSSHTSNLMAHMSQVTTKDAPSFAMQYDPKNNVPGWSWICDELDARGWVAANDDAHARDRIAQNLAKFQARKQQAYI